LVGSSDGFFYNLLNSDKAKTFASVFLEDAAVPRASELFAKPAKVGLPSPWHQDNAYWCVDNANGLTIWIALDECDESNGCVTYFKGTHKIGVVPHKPSFAPGSSQTIADESLPVRFAQDRIAPSLRPGDVIVHHCVIIHGSSANQSGKPRRGLTLQYIGKKSGYDAAMKARYEALLVEQIRIREAQTGKL
jgi:ectoine hydroxylase-related dioxygenase (phytanoyl-CoA dioxygenase family)